MILFIKKMLQFQANKRISAREILHDDFFTNDDSDSCSSVISFSSSSSSSSSSPSPSSTPLLIHSFSPTTEKDITN